MAAAAGLVLAGASLVCMGLLLVLLNMVLSSCCRPLLDYEDPEQEGSSFNVDSDDWLYGFGLDGDDGGAISLGGDDDGQGSFGVVPDFASGRADDSMDGFVPENFAGGEGDGIDINCDIGRGCYRCNCSWYVNGFMNAQSPNHPPDPGHERHYAEGSLSHPPIKDPYI